MAIAIKREFLDSRSQSFLRILILPHILKLRHLKSIQVEREAYFPRV